MKRLCFSLFDSCAATLLVLAFAMAGWKIFSRGPAPSFSSVAPAAVASAAAAGSAVNSPNISRPPQQISPDGRFQFDAGFISAEPGQAVHAASLVELRDGRLRAVWFSGSKEGAGDVTIQTSVMDPASLQWSPGQPIVQRQQLQRSLWRYVKKIGNPVIARAPDGSLLLWMVNVSLGGWAGSSISWVRSTDEGASWSSPRRLVTSPFLNISTLVKAAPVALANGDISLPVYHEFIAKFGEVLRLNSQGQVVDKVRIANSRTSLQPVLLVTGPERAQVYLRSGTAQALAYGTSAKRQLCNSGSCAQEFSYPYLLQSRDGYIHLVYTWHRTRIKHVRFDPLQAAAIAAQALTHASTTN